MIDHPIPKNVVYLLRNNRMKHTLILLFFIVTLGQAQETASVQVIARSLPDKVMLRWAVDQPLAWKKANEIGFLIERSTISRNGEAVIPIERQLMVTDPLKPKPLNEWEALATQDQNAAVIAQALFGDNFETEVPGSQMGAVYAINDELEQRFTFALIAAEQNFEAAMLAGWAFVDTSVKIGEKYMYKVYVPIQPENLSNIEEGTIYAGPDMYDPLPKPIGLVGVFDDSRVTLSWNFNLLQSYYTNYILERSDDNMSYMPLNGAPIFSAQQQQDTQQVSLFYNDSIPNNKKFYYRLKGKTAFGEIGPYSDPIEGQARKNLGFVPRIYRKEIPTDNKVILYWEFDYKGNELISGFELRRANTNKGPYETVKKNIPITTRKTSFEGLKRSNYFTIVAMGKNGTESESFSSLVQPVDSIPPLEPKGLTGVMDTTGIVKLSWDKNVEEDLKGYRIFRSNNPNVEFSEITKESFNTEIYNDTLPVRNLNTKVYYKLQAEDQRYNRSGFSQMLIVDKPDVLPPSPPVLTKYEVSQEGIRINWIPSSSQDVASHMIFRKVMDNQAALWEKIYETSAKNDSTFLDTKELERNQYSYTVIAKDSVGLESNPSSPLTVVWHGKTIDENDIKFSGTVNRELRFINLSWKTKDQEVLEYRLYRGTNPDNLKLYKTLQGSSKGYNDVDLEINSEYTYGLQLVLKGGRTSLIKKISVKY